MTVLVLGLFIFLGVHSVRMVADPWRTAQIARLGLRGWKGLYTLVSIAGLALVVWGYGLASAHHVVVWAPPVWGRHVAAFVTIPAFVLLAAAYVPGNRIKAALGHPMLAGVQAWALAHLLANGTLAAVVLFGAFLAWAVADFVSARRRDREAGASYPTGNLARDAMAGVIGLAAWALFGFVLHGWMTGVRAFG
ncbi:NnrU family protein [Cupriavidus sp. AcVe19-1a]|uniref:NnrU family protein n=1 Tax=Cupriavidus sp. AcVe19-1a TaxID=2821359 RepID=UPI001AEA1C02|nr:NnrU family protein [Cupriavidus sp. AcVe19-1a]MBP0630830.1 NnrU family protein [Cupriavidus sp. AcVe19-1a]